jgi:hypothetical protein
VVQRDSDIRRRESARVDAHPDSVGAGEVRRGRGSPVRASPAYRRDSARPAWFRITEEASALERGGHEAAARRVWASACLVALGAGRPREAATLARKARRSDLEAQCLDLASGGFDGPGLLVPQDVVLFVCGQPASGKSTVAWLVAGTVDAGLHSIAIDTSTIIAGSWERANRVSAGTVMVTRAEDPDAYRGVLGPWGERMAKRGWPAARLAVVGGHSIVVGTRRLGELRAAMREADRRGLRSLVLWVERTGTSASDNIDSGIRRLARTHGAVVENDGDIADLLVELGRILGLHGPTADTLRGSQTNAGGERGE